MINSIVRQSRHQFGIEKDVFGPRFMKNLISTFEHLLRCPKDDVVSFYPDYTIDTNLKLNVNFLYRKILHE